MAKVYANSCIKGGAYNFVLESIIVVLGLSKKINFLNLFSGFNGSAVHLSEDELPGPCLDDFHTIL